MDQPAFGRGYLARVPDVPSPDTSILPSSAREKRDHWALEAALVGLFAFLAAGWPFWLTRLPYTTSFPWDRFALVLSPGVCLVTAALIHWLVRGSTPARRAFLAALLVGLSIGVQNAQASVFRTDWNNATDLFWQISWRAPAIQPGSALLFDQIGLHYFEDDSLTGPLNWTYTPNTASPRLDYIFLNIPERIRMLNDLSRDVIIQKDFRAMAFTGTTNQSVVVKFNPPGCLQVLDPLRDASRADLSEFERRALPLSRPDLIQSVPARGVPAVPPTAIFGPEPKHKWCYYYERAALAAQYGRWDEILLLRNQSIGEGLFPEEPHEYLPFTEAYLHIFAWDDARQLTHRAYDGTAKIAPAFCALWKRAASWSAEAEGYPAAYQAARGELHCMD